MKSLTKKNRIPFRDRFKYWLDSRMSKGTISMIKFIVIATLIVVVTISVIICLVVKDAGEFKFVLWDNLAYALNAWLPFSEDSNDFGFLALTTIVSLTGVLFTSILIGIFASAIEQKVNNLRRGNSKVLEKEHYVVLGFKPGEYTLISELILAADGLPIVIVVAEAFEKNEMEDLIRNNVDIPGNVKIICRNIDICDSQALNCCSIPECLSVIVSPMDNSRTIKVILSAMATIDDNERAGINIVATTTDKNFELPRHLQEQQHITMIYTKDVFARMIARSCSQIGISKVFEEFFDFSGSEFYSNKVANIGGKTFAEVVYSTDKAVPIGYIRDNRIVVNPEPDIELLTSDSLVYLARNQREIMVNDADITDFELKHIEPFKEKSRKLVVIGYNESFPTVISELPDSIGEIIYARTGHIKEDLSVIQSCERSVKIYDKTVFHSEDLRELVHDADHVILLNSTSESDVDDEDVENIMLLIKLRDLKNHYGYTYSITAEMANESSRKLVLQDNQTDYIVASNMTAMILAQLVINPELQPMFGELISNAGNELVLKPLNLLGISEGNYTIQALRMEALSRGYLLVGYVFAGKENETIINPELSETVSLKPEDYLAVVGRV